MACQFGLDSIWSFYDYLRWKAISGSWPWAWQRHVLFCEDWRVKHSVKNVSSLLRDLSWEDFCLWPTIRSEHLLDTKIYEHLDTKIYEHFIMPSRQTDHYVYAWDWIMGMGSEKMIEEKPITLNVFSHAQDYEHILLLGLNKMERKNLDEGWSLDLLITLY